MLGPMCVHSRPPVISFDLEKGALLVWIVGFKFCCDPPKDYNMLPGFNQASVDRENK